VIRCAVVGASGYSGAELVRLLARHPLADLVSVQADSSAGERWEDLHPHARHLFRGRIERLDVEALRGLDVVFLALPHGESARVAGKLAGRVGAVIDLSGDLRLEDAESYRAWYGREHEAPDLLGRAVYGLPELFGADLPGATLVACAGCYATAIQLAAAPALGLSDAVESDIIAAAVSGTTGAGRKADTALSFSEVAGNLRAYRVGRHQHIPEIVMGLRRRSGREVRLTFVPHLAPIPRGILATVVLRTTRTIPPEELVAAYERAYESAPFVRIVDPAERLPEVRDVVGTNFCDIAPVVDHAAASVVVVAVLDNLGKGAAGQGVQVMNAVLGLPEITGLVSPADRPRAEVVVHG